MELKEIFDSLRKNFKIIAVVAVLLCVASVAVYYFVPKKFIATGSILVSRSVEPSTGTEFSYEGYYARLNARNYTETFIGLLESLDVRDAALKKIGVPVNGQTLRHAGRNVRINSAAPQVVLVEIKRDTYNLADEYWKALVSSAGDLSGGQSNDIGDPNISLLTMKDTPVVYEEYRNVYLYAAVGFLLGGFLASFFVVLKEYLD